MKKIIAFLYLTIFFLGFFVFKEIKKLEKISKTYPELVLNSRINKMRRNMTAKSHKTSQKKLINYMKKQQLN